MAADSTKAAPADVPADAPVASPSGKQYVVKAEAAVVHVNTVYERYLYKGATVPEAVEAWEIDRLLDLGLITEALVAVDAPAGV